VRGSVLYTVMTEITTINHMYQTSLAQFLGLFEHSVLEAPRAHITASRVANIVSTLTDHIYNYVARGLYEEHRRLFAFLLCAKMETVAGIISPVHMSLFVKRGSTLDPATQRQKPCPWMSTSVWLGVLEAARSISELDKLPDKIIAGEARWKAWVETEACEKEICPLRSDMGERVSDFLQLTLVRIFREDRLASAMEQYIHVTLGPKFTESISLDLDKAVAESKATTPLIFLLSSGADPSSQVEQLARRKKTPVRAVSLGQGQEAAVTALLEGAVSGGGWVLLQNAHLGLGIIQQIPKWLAKQTEIHPMFRIWITTEPHPKFPITLLQSSLKLTNQPPSGVRAGLMRSFRWITQDTLDAVSSVEWRCLVYSLCFLHTAVQERRKFGPLGWNVPYEFNLSDLAASVAFLQNHFLQNESRRVAVSWQAVRYMIVEVQYGGRVTDELDRRLFASYGDKWLNPKVFQTDFEFYKSYGLPHSPDVVRIREYIETLDTVDTPEIFGLHPNADLAVRTLQGQELITAVLETQPKSTEGAASSSEDGTVSVAHDLLQRLPQSFAVDEVADKFKKLGGSRPLNIFLRQEIWCVQRVLDLVSSSLNEALLALRGGAVMTPALTLLTDSLTDARVPPSWAKTSWYASGLGNWYGGLLQRVQQLRQWMLTGRPNAFWLTGFFNPQGFLTAMTQEVARRQGWPLDSVAVTTEVTKLEREDVRDGPPDGVYIWGLFLDGAGWDRRHAKLCDLQPKMMGTTLPVLLVSAQPVREGRLETLSYECPVYKTPKRTDLNFVCFVDLKTDDPPAKWILRGVGALCTKD